MNEIPMIFDLPDNTTIDETETWSVSICIIGYEKTNFTIILTCIANGIKLPPFIIFKLKKVSWGNFSQEVIVQANPTGWMNENEMLY